MNCNSAAVTTVFLLIGFFLWASYSSFFQLVIHRLSLSLSLVSRSRCDNCGHVLSPADLVPVFSWLALSGRCRYCLAPIDVRMPSEEALCGLCGMVASVLTPPLHLFATGFLVVGSVYAISHIYLCEFELQL